MSRRRAMTLFAIGSGCLGVAYRAVQAEEPAEATIRPEYKSPWGKFELRVDRDRKDEPLSLAFTYHNTSGAPRHCVDSHSSLLAFQKWMTLAIFDAERGRYLGNALVRPTWDPPMGASWKLVPAGGIIGQAASFIHRKEELEKGRFDPRVVRGPVRVQAIVHRLFFSSPPSISKLSANRGDEDKKALEVEGLHKLMRNHFRYVTRLGRGPEVLRSNILVVEN